MDGGLTSVKVVMLMSARLVNTFYWMSYNGLSLLAKELLLVPKELTLLDKNDYLFVSPSYSLNFTIAVTVNVIGLSV